MAEFSDVVKALIEDTKSGKLEWGVWTDSGGYWVAKCNGMSFQVRRSGQVELFGDVPSTSLGMSSELLGVLQQYKPLEPEVTREQALQRALECLRGDETEVNEVDETGSGPQLVVNQEV